MVITSVDPTAAMGLVVDWARRAGADLASLEVRRRSLEDVYLAVAGDRS